MEKNNRRPPYQKNNQKPYGDRKRSGGPSSVPRVPADMIWGVHAAVEAWGNPKRVVKAAFATEKAVAQLQGAIDQAKENGIKRPEIEIIERRDFQSKTKLHDDLVHQGIALKVEDLPEVFLDEILAQQENKTHSAIMILDQVTDPHNVGAIMRSCAAFGACALVMQTRHAPHSLNGVLAKIASGAVEHLPVVMETNLSRAIETCKERGFQAYSFDERGDAVLGCVEMHGKGVLVMGAEGKGVRPSVRDACDHVLRMETCPPIYSLNVSNAAAVALYEQCRNKK